MAPRARRQVLVLCCLLGLPALLRAQPAASPRADEAARTVFLVGELSDADLLAFTAGLCASKHPGVLLFDSPAGRRYTKAFLEGFRPGRLVPVGEFPAGVDIGKRYKVPGLVDRADTNFFPEPTRAVIAPARPRGLLLQAACLAGVVRAPLLVAEGEKPPPGWTRIGTGAGLKEIFLVGGAKLPADGPAKAKVHSLADEKAVFNCLLDRRLKRGPVRTLVVTNPHDAGAGKGRVSVLAPWIALQKRGVLLLTNEAGDNVEQVVREALRDRPELARVENVVLAGSPQALPTQRRPNPLPGGKDVFIETEPLAPFGPEPFSFAVGRVFHPDLNVPALLFARQRLRPGTGPKALVVSNPGGSLPLLETFSRNTAEELRRGGYDVTALLGREAGREDVRRLLPEQSLFLWEGHHSTLVRDYAVHQWPEPLRPSLVVLQSCLTLAEPKALPFLERGAVAVVSSSARTYSGSGGALSLTFFSSLLNEDRTAGAALRDAKNFLLAFSLLKEKRLGEESKLGGANVRAAWAFSLWGDPMVKLPRPPKRADEGPPVRHRVRGNTITVTLPPASDKVASERYQAEVRPNARLAGLVTKAEEMEELHRLVPLVFREVRLPQVPPGKTPRLRTSLPGRNWVFCWDARRAAGYLLVIPRARDEVRFRVSWD